MKKFQKKSNLTLNSQLLLQDQVGKILNNIKPIQIIAQKTSIVLKKNIKGFSRLLIIICFLTFISQFITFYIRKLDFFPLYIILPLANIWIIILKIKLVKLFYKCAIDEQYNFKENIGTSFWKNITASLAFLLKIIPVYLLYLGISWLILKINIQGTLISKIGIMGLINYLVTAPIYAIYVYQIIIASIQEIGGFKNNRLSRIFNKENRNISAKLIIIYFLPNFISRIIGLFIMKNLSKSIILSIVPCINPLIFLLLIYFYIINLKDPIITSVKTK